MYIQHVILDSDSCTFCFEVVHFVVLYLTISSYEVVCSLEHAVEAELLKLYLVATLRFLNKLSTELCRLVLHLWS